MNNFYTAIVICGCGVFLPTFFISRYFRKRPIPNIVLSGCIFTVSITVIYALNFSTYAIIPLASTHLLNLHIILCAVTLRENPSVGGRDLMEQPKPPNP